MKAVVIKEQNGEVAVEERERPSPGPGQVLIRVHACGVCHSDLAVLQGAFPFAQFPIVPGHEVAGVVEEVGEGVAWPETGARVGMPWLYSSCGHCEQCTRGDEVMCQVAPQVTGITTDGGYAEFMLAPAAYVAPIPDALDFADALPGLAPDGTLAVLGAAAGEISVGPMDLIGSRRHLIGSPSGSRKDIRDALQFAVNHDVRPHISSRPLEDAADALNEMHGGGLRGRIVLMV